MLPPPLPPTFRDKIDTLVLNVWNTVGWFCMLALGLIVSVINWFERK